MTDDPYVKPSHDLLFSPTLCGKECQACHRVLPYSIFPTDSSIRDGRALICPKCKATPRLSTAENASRVREANFSSDAVRKQRRENEEDFLDRDPRGRVMYLGDFVHKLEQAGVVIIVGEAHFAQEVSLYVFDLRHPPTSAFYVGWLPTGLIQEFSEYEYNKYSIPQWETVHGYRGVLKNLISNGYLTEDKCSKTFGPCDEKVWVKEMFGIRNKQ